MNKSNIYLGRRGFDRFSDELSRHGYTPVPIEPLAGLNEIVADHADTLVFDLNASPSGTSTAALLLSAVPLPGCECIFAKQTPQGGYPTDTCLNALAIGGCVFGRVKSLSSELTALVERQGLKLVNVRQGYARCAALPVAGGVICADAGLSAALERHGIEVLRITPGHIALPGCEYGFIGGATAVDSTRRRVICFGSIAAHPDADRIRRFIERRGYELVELAGETEIASELVDIGGAIVR